MKPQRPPHADSTTILERIIILAVVVILPLDSHVQVIPNFSMLYLLFMFLIVYVFMFRLNLFFKTLGHPVFLTLYALIVVGVVMESFHSNSDYSELMRITNMVLGGVLVAVICRDRDALKMALYGYIISGVWISIYLFLTVYGVLSGVGAGNFKQASMLRAQAFDESAIHANENTLAFLAAQGLVVSLSFALLSRKQTWRLFYSGITLFCLVASFLPMSRSGIAIAIMSCAVVLFSYGVLRMKPLIVALLSGIVILWFVPDAVFSRFSFTSSTDRYSGKQESRAMVYSASIKHISENLLTGVGRGNFWGQWGLESDFGKRGHVAGSHNIFFQITVYWGIAGFLLLILLVWNAYICLPRTGQKDILSTSLKGISMSLLLVMMVKHLLYAKEFTLGLGLLVGTQLWIWNKSDRPGLSTERRRSARAHSLVH